MKHLYFYKNTLFHEKYENTRKEANFFETFAGKYCMTLRFIVSLVKGRTRDDWWHLQIELMSFFIQVTDT